MEAMRANCGGDYLRLCAGMKPGGPEVKACFKRNRQNLSPGCSQAIAAYDRGEITKEQLGAEQDTIRPVPQRCHPVG